MKLITLLHLVPSLRVLEVSPALSHSPFSRVFKLSTVTTVPLPLPVPLPLLRFDYILRLEVNVKLYGNYEALQGKFICKQTIRMGL
jgi:hypothetical protein